MPRKSKLWSKLFTKKEAEEQLVDNADNATSYPDQKRSIVESELKGMEVPHDKCHFCYEPFIKGEMGYQCVNCEVIYHYPNCIKNQTNCRACGEKIILVGNVYKFLKLRSVICPNCGMKVKLFFESDPKLHISCPNCGHEGHLPNPYLKELQSQEIQDNEDLVDSENKIIEPTYGEGRGDIDSSLEPEISINDLHGGRLEEADEDSEIWEEEGYNEINETDNELLEKQELIPEPYTKLEEQIEDGPKIIKADKRKKRKPKLVTLDQSVICNICTKEIHYGLPLLVCRCGKKYHENCASEIGECPTCDCNLFDYQNLIEDYEIEPEYDHKLKHEYDHEHEHVFDLEQNQKNIIEPGDHDLVEPELDLGTELDTTLTFENLEVGEQNKIIKSIGQGIAKAPGLEFNVIYIYGKNNEVLTHFLQSIGNYILYSETELKVRYTKMEKYLNEYNQAKDLDKLNLFEEFYSEADVLLLDNFHNISNKRAEKEAFFKIFDKLLGQGKQLVIAGSSIIDEIKGLDKKNAKRLIDITGLIIKIG